MRQEVAQLGGQIGKLTEAIALGGHVEALLGGIKDREARRTRLRQELADLDGLDRVSAIDLAVLHRDLEKLLLDWRSWIGGHNRAARQILVKLVAGRLIFTPMQDGGAWFYEFTGSASWSRSWPASYPPVRNGGAPGQDRRVVGHPAGWC